MGGTTPPQTPSKKVFFFDELRYLLLVEFKSGSSCYCHGEVVPVNDNGGKKIVISCHHFLFENVSVSM